MLSKQKKDRIIEKFKTHAHDTGSSQVQIAILTEEIKELTKHLKEHPQDYSSRRGLIKKVNERKKLLKYLRKENLEAWEKIVVALKIKVQKETEKEKIDADEIGLPVEEVEEKVETVTDDAP
ncbi:MAG: 30S ribosomal protein S15 [Patescibacteria group bacterium]|jgi:small subunit ribosomal protein S15